MQIDWVAFTPVPSLAGGVILGFSAAMYVLLHGRILGISGIVSGLLHPKNGDVAWRFALILGLLTAPILASVFFGIRPLVEIKTSWFAIFIAGLLVGFGTQYGSGCTSGHGICGLSRLSPRSVVATATFMGAGFLTVFVLHHLLGA
jgi:uncharacterized membrane protein YedE/YeeE